MTTYNDYRRSPYADSVQAARIGQPGWTKTAALHKRAGTWEDIVNYLKANSTTLGGAAIGGGLGGAIGGLAYGRRGGLLGALLGAVGGGAYGYHKQQKDLAAAMSNVIAAAKKRPDFRIFNQAAYGATDNFKNMMDVSIAAHRKPDYDIFNQAAYGGTNKLLNTLTNNLNARRSARDQYVAAAKNDADALLARTNPDQDAITTAVNDQGKLDIPDSYLDAIEANLLRRNREREARNVADAKAYADTVSGGRAR